MTGTKKPTFKVGQVVVVYSTQDPDEVIDLQVINGRDDGLWRTEPFVREFLRQVTTWSPTGKARSAKGAHLNEYSFPEERLWAIRPAKESEIVDFADAVYRRKLRAKLPSDLKHCSSLLECKSTTLCALARDLGVHQEDIEYTQTAVSNRLAEVQSAQALSEKGQSVVDNET